MFQCTYRFLVTFQRTSPYAPSRLLLRLLLPCASDTSSTRSKSSSMITPSNSFSQSLRKLPLLPLSRCTFLSFSLTGTAASQPVPGLFQVFLMIHVVVANLFGTCRPEYCNVWASRTGKAVWQLQLQLLFYCVSRFQLLWLRFANGGASLRCRTFLSLLITPCCAWGQWWGLTASSLLVVCVLGRLNHTQNKQYFHHLNEIHERNKSPDKI